MMASSVHGVPIPKWVTAPPHQLGNAVDRTMLILTHPPNDVTRRMAELRRVLAWGRRERREKREEIVTEEILVTDPILVENCALVENGVRVENCVLVENCVPVRNFVEFHEPVATSTLWLRRIKRVLPPQSAIRAPLRRARGRTRRVRVVRATTRRAASDSGGDGDGGPGGDGPSNKLNRTSWIAVGTAHRFGGSP